jgi:uncharacterized membrane protein
MYDKQGRNKRLQAIEKSKNTLLAEDDEILQNLEKLSRKRDDIFGSVFIYLFIYFFFFIYLFIF